MAQKDYYDVLGIQRAASPDEIKAAFRNMARQYHPDVNKAADSEERFKEINEAYAVLSDPDKRAAYDRYGHAGVNQMGGVPDFTSMDFSDIFEELFGFGMGGGGGRRSARSPRRGADLTYPVGLTFEESVFGCDKEIEVTRDETCMTCRGTGAEPGSSPSRCSTCEGRGEVRQVRQTFLGSMVQVTTCPACNGAGQVITKPCPTCRGRGMERKTIKKTVTIPAGIDNGQQIRLAGEGQPGANGGPNGNLYLEIQVRAHKFFRRKQDDILLNLDVNIAQAALGAEVEVPTVDGMTRLSIPAGTQPGRVFTLRGKGVPHLRSNGRGDELVVVNLAVPAKLSAEQRKLFEQLALTLGSEVHPQEKSFFDRLRDIF